jgi:hypothetical protein
LLRCLLYHLSKNELTLVKVYATAVLPLFSACASATYRELKSLLIDPSDLSLVSKTDYVVSKIQSMYSCLGKCSLPSIQILPVLLLMRILYSFLVLRIDM